MDEFDLLPFLHPDISYSPQVVRLLEEIRSVLAWYHLSYLGNDCRSWLVYFLALADSLDVEGLEEFCKRLEFSPSLSRWAVAGRKKALKVGHDFYRKEEHKPSEIYHLLEDLDVEWLLFIMAKTQQEATRRAISVYFRDLREVRPGLRGKDLKEMGIVPGPIYRKILDLLLDGRLNEELTSREEEVEFVRRHFIEKQEIGELGN
jgi:tRNA nucleotidyltransferase (CCA-adding enzyme)